MNKYKEKVIQGIACCTQSVDKYGGCFDCSYRGDELCEQKLGRDVIFLLENTPFIEIKKEEDIFDGEEV